MTFDSFGSMGMMLIIVGVLLVLIGIGVLFADKIPFFGKMPGDIHIEGENWSFHFPIVTSIILSILLTLILNLFIRK